MQSQIELSFKLSTHISKPHSNIYFYRRGIRKTTQYIYIIMHISDGKFYYRDKQIEKYLMPIDIDAKIILQAFKMQEQENLRLRLLSCNRGQQYVLESKAQKEITKLDLLHVAGKEMINNSPERYRVKSTSKQIRNVKLFLGKPITKILDTISQDPDSQHYQKELNQLKKLSQNTTKKLVSSYERNSSSQRDFEPSYGKTDKHFNKLWEKDDLQYYQQMILSNPMLYSKIMLAKNDSIKELKSQRKLQFRKTSLIPQSKDNNYQNTFIPKIHVNTPRFQGNEISKLTNEEKRNVCFLQYRQFQLTLTLSHWKVIHPSKELTYKAYICKGNNGFLVKTILKSRPWWSIRPHSDLDNCNLIWTEWKQTKTTEKLQQNESKISNNKKLKQSIMLNSKDRQYLLTGNKKINNMKKIIGQSHQLWIKYERNPQLDNYLNFSNKITESKFEQIAKKIFRTPDYNHQQVSKEHKMTNHVPGCLHLHSKKLLFLNLKKYYEKQNKDIFSIVPLTFHIKKGTDDEQFIRFTQYFDEISKQTGKGKSNNIWICKPGENSNRGNGISVHNMYPAIQSLAALTAVSNRTLIIQKYFENPFLYNKRKFDIRCYILITTNNGIMKGYWYEQGYIRTASKQFNLKNLQNKFIHLTNDAVQKKGQEYGKFQNFNKISYTDLQKYLQNNCDKSFKFQETLIKMKQIATDLIFSTAHKLNPKKKQYTFQLFGLDFMLDDKLNPFLIEANSNPCIQVDGTVLGRVIPTMLQNVIRVAVDPIFPPPYSQTIRSKYTAPNNIFESNKFVLVYDSYNDEPKIESNECQKLKKQEEIEQNQNDFQE